MDLNGLARDSVALAPQHKRTLRLGRSPDGADALAASCAAAAPPVGRDVRFTHAP
jgi:hypothetical protein